MTRIICACASLAILTGCADTLARRETIAFSGGNAVADNRAIQTIDPWPRSAARRGWAGDGEKAAQAIRRYRSGDASASPAPAAILVPSPAPPTSSGASPTTP